jgi:hypothetical protein
MPPRPDDDERRRLKAEFKKRERAEERSHMILDEAALTDLLGYVASHLESRHCDHTLRATREWAKARSVDADALVESLSHFGGYCDCEVTFNVNAEAIFR